MYSPGSRRNWGQDRSSGAGGGGIGEVLRGEVFGSRESRGDCEDLLVEDVGELVVVVVVVVVVVALGKLTATTGVSVGKTI